MLVQTRHHNQRSRSLQLMTQKVNDWSAQLQEIGFQKVKKVDGAITHHYQAADRRSSFWTQITVRQVGRPNPDSWQVTFARIENQVGFLKIHNLVKKIDVVVYTSCSTMLTKINKELARTPGFLQKISN